MNILSDNSKSNIRKPFVKELPHEKCDYFEILSKAETERLRSGLVTLLPGKDVGWHSTENYEELLIVIGGQGKLLLKGYDDKEIAANQIAYNPPRTEHNVVNTGSAPLSYIYVVASVV